MTQKLIEKLIQEYGKKTYEELLELPQHFQLILPELETQNQTIEFLRVPYGEDSLKIFFKRVYWQTPQETLISYTQQYILMGLTQKGAERKAAKTLEKVRKEGVDHSEEGLPKSTIAAMEQMREENPELSFPHFPSPNISELIFNYATYSDGFIKKIDNAMITTQEEVGALFLRESQFIEQAKWFGKTGLSEDVERELVNYLRLEFGEILDDQGSLKANDLNYLGTFHQSDTYSPDSFFNPSAVSVHIWKIRGSKEYAYIEIFENGDYCMSIGNNLPQNVA